MMKDTAVLLNYSRWGIVDEDAVIKALNAKKLRLFITDFSSEKILNHKQNITLQKKLLKIRIKKTQAQSENWLWLQLID